MITVSIWDDRMISIEPEEEDTAVKEHLSQNAGKVPQDMIEKLYERTGSRIEQLYGNREIWYIAVNKLLR